MNTDFKAFAEDLDSIEVLRVTIGPDGEFRVPNEKDGRIARVTSQRGRLREFLLAFCRRLECPDEEHAAVLEPQKARPKRAS